MRVIVAGGSGFLGQALTTALSAEGRDVVVLSRHARATEGPIRTAAWTPDAPPATSATTEWAREIDGADAVINLAGAGIADRRWNEVRKHDLIDSRLVATRALTAAIAAATTRPSVFISGSAIGYYGTSDTTRFDESSAAGHDFLARLCGAWEAEAVKSRILGCRVVLLRTGIVLARSGGALKKMIPPFLLFAGGPIATGQQVMSWIHLDDWVRLVRFALTTAAMAGPVNATAPNPVTNAEFSHALGAALHRPSWLPMPGFALRAIVGEMADVALINGQRVIPRRALDLGFTFRYPEIDAAMASAVRA
jgi:hypothetical protein